MDANYLKCVGEKLSRDKYSILTGELQSALEAMKRQQQREEQNRADFEREC